jgi:hypothetical protein
MTRPSGRGTLYQFTVALVIADFVRPSIDPVKIIMFYVKRKIPNPFLYKNYFEIYMTFF